MKSSAATQYRDMPLLGTRILLLNALTQLVELVERDILDDMDVREGMQVVEYDLMPFYRERPNDLDQLERMDAQWWRSLQSAMLPYWVNLRFDLLERQGVWDRLVERGLVDGDDLDSISQVSEITENMTTLAEARLPLLNTLDALAEQADFLPFLIVSFSQPLDDQLKPWEGLSVTMGVVVDNDDQLEDPLCNMKHSAGPGAFDRDMDLNHMPEDSFFTDHLSDERAIEELVEEVRRHAPMPDPDETRWEHQQELLLKLCLGPVEIIGEILDESMFSGWQVELLRQAQSWLARYDAVTNSPEDDRANALARFTMDFHPIIEAQVSALFYNMRLQLAAVAIMSNANWSPFDEQDKLERGERLQEVAGTDMFLRMFTGLGRPLYRMILTDRDALSVKTNRQLH